MAPTSLLVLRFCEDFIARNGYAPSVREIQFGCGLGSTSVVAYHLARLRSDGHIDFVSGTARTIRVLPGAA